MSTLSVLLHAVLHASSDPAKREPSVSLLTEARRLPSLYGLMEYEDDIDKMRVVVRTEDDQLSMMDLYRNRRFIGTVEQFSILKLQREFGFNKLEAERFCDFLWNFRYVLVNTRTKVWTQELAIKRILDAVDLGLNDLVIGEEG